jgi:hypothetical protein
MGSKQGLTVRDTAQESEMNALGVIYSVMWLIKPKKYNNYQYYADNYLGTDIPKDSITG